ncbi:MAG: glycosyltransferase family 1 protein [Candidatus Gracilibacteria bacterium]|jgi:glycosyltransferase involved in cell wall biosynthesis
MKIAILADPISNQKAGIHTYTKELFSALLKLDNQNEYYFIHSENNNFFNDKNHFIIEKSKILIPFRETYRKFVKIPQLLKKLKPDIVIETCHIGPFNTPKNCKKITIIHDLTPILFPNFHIKKSVIIHKLLLKKIVKDADLIITPSTTTKTDIIKKYRINEEKIKIIHGAPSSETSKNSQFPKNIKAPYLLYLGTIEPRKNLQILIESFLELKRENNIPHSLVLAGEIGWKSKKILSLAKNNKEIIFTGHINEDKKITLYKNADMFIYPSLYEGFGLPPLEAMSHNIPVICSTGGSLKELFNEYALMFDPQDKKTLKNHILKLIKNKTLKENLIKKAFEYSKSFTWQSSALQLLSEFKNLIK